MSGRFFADAVWGGLMDGMGFRKLPPDPDEALVGLDSLAYV